MTSRVQSLSAKTGNCVPIRNIRQIDGQQFQELVPWLWLPDTILPTDNTTRTVCRQFISVHTLLSRWRESRA